MIPTHKENSDYPEPSETSSEFMNFSSINENNLVSDLATINNHDGQFIIQSAKNSLITNGFIGKDKANNAKPNNDIIDADLDDPNELLVNLNRNDIDFLDHSGNSANLTMSLSNSGDHNNLLFLSGKFY